MESSRAEGKGSEKDHTKAGQSLTNLTKLFDTAQKVPTTEPNQLKRDEMDEFHHNKSLIKKFMCFLQAFDKWVYKQPMFHLGERPEAVTLEEGDDLAVEFAKYLREEKRSNGITE